MNYIGTRLKIQVFYNQNDPEQGKFNHLRSNGPPNPAGQELCGSNCPLVAKSRVKCLASPFTTELDR